MRPAYLLPAAALLLGPAAARGEPPPRVAVRLDYQRGPGGAACPAEELLHDEVARRMGYDPFDPGAAGRLVVVVARQNAPQARRFEAHVDRYAPGGEKTWSEVYPGGTRCALMFPSLASEISAVLEPAPPPLRTTPPSVAAPELPAAPASPAAAPELPAVQVTLMGEPPRWSVFDGPAGIARAIAFAVAGVGLGVGSGFAAASAIKAHEIRQTQATLEGPAACNHAGVLPPAGCAQLVTLAQAHDTYANVAIGVMAAAGAIGVGALTSILLVSTPSHTVRLKATAAGALTTVTLQGSW